MLQLQTFLYGIQHGYQLKERFQQLYHYLQIIKVYTISLYPQSQFQYLTNELQNFDFDAARDISEFELLARRI